MTTDKPHKGQIKEWCKLPTQKGLGYMIEGIFVDHAQFGTGPGHTSYVVAHDEKTGEIETRNSRYTLLGDELPAL